MEYNKYNKKYVYFIGTEVIVWLSNFYRDHTAKAVSIIVDPCALNRIRIDDGKSVDICSDEGRKCVETYFAQYGMGSEETMEMVLNAICTYTKWVNKTLLKGVPMA